VFRRLEHPPPTTVVVPLGAEPAAVGVADARDGAPGRASPWDAAPYLLVVGTLEPRKNQELALEVFESLQAEFEDLQLVIAGRYGWGADALAERLRHHPLAGTRVHWLQDVHDDDLDRLYRQAFLVLVPSRGEGFGLPAVEALSRGAAVIASTGGGVPEAVGDGAELLDPDDLPAWSAAVREQLGGGGARADALGRVASFRPRSWADAAAGIDAALLDRFAPARPCPATSDHPPR
jgi:glycosyltransferase involved in cell wall biosynthesis